MLTAPMQTQPPDAPHRQKGRTTFALHVLHVDQRAAWEGEDPGDFGRRAACEQAANAVMQAARDEGLEAECVEVVGLEGAFAGGAEALRGALAAAAGQDETARDDLLRAVRQDVLERAAAARGCEALVLGDCADLAAARVLAAVVCGAGGALPAAQQPRFAWAGGEGRSGLGEVARPQLLRPLLEATAKELALMCRYERLYTGGGYPPERAFGAGAPPPRAGTSLNALTADFVAAASKETPSTVHAVLRTVGRLRPFGAPEVKGRKADARSGLLGGQGNDEPTCAFCSAPLDAERRGEGAAECYRCARWLLPSLGGGGGEAGSALIHDAAAARIAERRAMTRDEMRAEIADALL